MCPGLTREEALQAISGEIVHSNEENVEEEEDDDDKITQGRIRKLSMDSASHFFKDIDDKFRGPSLITFDGEGYCKFFWHDEFDIALTFLTSSFCSLADQTLYSDGANFESNPRLANYIYLLLKNDVHVAIVTAAGYEYQTAKYEFRLSGLLNFFKQKKLELDRCMNFYVFGGECNYLLQVSLISFFIGRILRKFRTNFQIQRSLVTIIIFILFENLVPVAGLHLLDF